jgi:hypothetical protein
MRKHGRGSHSISGWVMLSGLALAVLLGGCSVGSPPTWQNIGPTEQSIISLAVSPLSPPTLYAGTSGQGLFRSRDEGSTWQAINTGLPTGVTVHTILLDLTQVGLVYVGTDAGVFLSASSGDRWQRASQGLPDGADGAVTALALTTDDPLTIYAGTARAGVYISHDGAKTWKASGQGLPAGAAVRSLLAETQGLGGHLFAALTGAGVYRSNDHGASWSASSGGLPAGTDGLSLLRQPSDPGGLYLGTNAGLYRSTDEGLNWKAENTGLGATPPQVYALALNDQQVGFLYAATAMGLYRSVDGGADWGQLAAGLPQTHSVVALAVIGSERGLGTIYTAAGQVYRYPSTAAAATGQIFTIVIIGALALFFVWLFIQQRRILRRLTPQAPSAAVSLFSETNRPDPARARLGNTRHPALADDKSDAVLQEQGEIGPNDAPIDGQN